MRRDVFIENDSGGFSVLAAAAADAIIEDARQDDFRFVKGFQAMLLMLQGDDSMPVRIVVDEPLLPEEEQQWLGHASWRIDAPDGGLIVMGGFDPDVLGWWRDEHGAGEDGRGVAFVQATPGSWRVDVYAHVGSMNGRAILGEANERPGAFFRRCHPGRAFPGWLAHMLDHSGEDDPGHEDDWRDVKRSVADGVIAVDAEAPSVVGFLVHFTPSSGPDPEAPGDGWFDADAGQRVPAIFPVGLASDAADPEVESFLDRVLGREKPAQPIPAATEMIAIIETWPGDTLKRLGGGGASVLAVKDSYYLHWIASLGSDSPPLFEFLVMQCGAWQPPEPTPEFAVVSKGRSAWELGPPPNAGGWFTWWAGRKAAGSLAGLPDDATLDLAMLRRDAADDDVNEAVGRALYSGSVKAGAWHVEDVSPAVTRETLDDALALVREIAERGSITLRSDDERGAFDAAAAMFAPGDGDLSWDGATVRPTDGDERTLLILAGPVFRTRFAGVWPMDPIDD